MNDFCMHKHLSLCQKINTVVVVISPLLAMYGTGVSTVTLLDVSILLVICLNLLVGRNSIINRVQKRIGFIMGLIIMNLVLVLVGSCLKGNPDISIAMRTSRFLWYLFFAMFCLSDDYFSVNLALKLYEFFAVFAAVFLIAQFILLYVFGFSLKGYISFLPVMREELQTFSSELYASSFARPRSIFAEPSQFGIYAAGYLGISIFYGRIELIKYEIWIIMLAMLMSASTTAILGLVVLLIGYFFNLIKKKNIEGFFIIVGFLFGIVIVFFLMFSHSVFFSDRILLAIDRMPISFMNRMGGFLEYANRLKSFDLLEVLLGIGMTLDGMMVWYSGTAKILLYWGIGGGVVFLLIIIRCFCVMKNAQRSFFIVFLILSLFSEILVSNWLILFLPFVLRNLSDTVYWYNKNEKIRFSIISE